MTFDRSAATVVVFSHPNHELAIFGFLQSVRPSIVYLTDGGGPERVEQTRTGLRRIGLLDRAHFLDFTEKSFYDGLLDLDLPFYEGVASRLRDALRRLRPSQVLCDAVEFYNPVHDMSLPLVRRALDGSAGTAVFEVPLVYERSAKSGTYEIQRSIEAAGSGPIEFVIDDAHVEAKVCARDEVYTILTAQLGSVITGIPREHLATEVIVPAPESIPEPGGPRTLRYEHRAELLLERGEIERKITHQGHYAPVVQSLMAVAPPASSPQ